MFRWKAQVNDVKNLLRNRMRVWVFFDTSKQNDPVRWVEARVVSVDENMVKCKRSRKGPTMLVAYEHVSIAPRGDLERELAEGTLENVMEAEPVTGYDTGTQAEMMDDILGKEYEGMNE